jgi:hypothetical protein
MQALATQVTQQQLHADELKKLKLLSVDTIHASNPPQGLQARPPTVSKSENFRGRHEREHATPSRQLTPREGSSRSPRKVMAVLTALIVIFMMNRFIMLCAGLRACRCWESTCWKSDEGGGGCRHEMEIASGLDH